MQLALQAITFAALGTAGQRCTTTRRLFLHSSIAPSFTKSLVDAYKSVAGRMGHPLDPNTLVGPVHSRDTVKRYEAAIANIKQQGGEILIGGNKVEMEGELAGGNYVEPTIVLVKDQETFPMMKEETFAPSESLLPLTSAPGRMPCFLRRPRAETKLACSVLYVSTFETLEEAIELNNSVAQGLSSSLFSQDMASALKFIHSADTGIINVNGSTSGAEIGMGFGGNKSTGNGREAGAEAWKQYCRWSSCTLNWSNEVGLAQGVKFDV